MRFTNLDFPFNLELILSFFDLKTWCGWIPNLFKLSFDYYEIDIIVGKTPPGFSYRKKSSFFIYNNSVLLTAFLFGQFIFFVSVIVTYFCDGEKNKKCCLIKKMNSIKRAMIWNGYIRFTSASLIKIAVFSFLQILDLNWETWPNKIASFLAIFGAVYVTAFPFIILLIMVVNRNNL